MNLEDSVRQRLDRLVRRERGRLVANLLRQLGSQHLDLAEDVAQEALLKAISIWPFDGLPENPGAWLAAVARNKAIDRLRRLKREVDTQFENDSGESAGSNLFAVQVEDPELRLILLCCHTELSELERLTLTLKLACGFTTKEIAEVFLAQENSIGQRIARAKRRLRSLGRDLDQLPLRFGIESRLPSALKVLYIMFSMGYAPLSGNHSMRIDIAFEALRLVEELAANEITGNADSQALAALLCFQGSRLEARESVEGEIIVFSDQDRDMWNRALIERGFHYLVASKQTDTLSRFHIEAAIAATHATAVPGDSKHWQSIASQYEQLEAMVNSPIVRINASVAMAMAGDPAGAMEKLDSLVNVKHLKDYAPFHVARAEVLRFLRRYDEANVSYQQAIECKASTPVIRHIEERMVSCL